MKLFVNVRLVSSPELGSDVWSVFTSSSALFYSEERLHGGEKQIYYFTCGFQNPGAFYSNHRRDGSVDSMEPEAD